jgi:hypothetical protein
LGLPGFFLPAALREFQRGHTVSEEALHLQMKLRELKLDNLPSGIQTGENLPDDGLALESEPEWARHAASYAIRDRCVLMA